MAAQADLALKNAEKNQQFFKNFRHQTFHAQLTTRNRYSILENADSESSGPNSQDEKESFVFDEEKRSIESSHLKHS